MFYGHHAKIVCLAWSPDNEHFASGGMDMMVYVWTLSDPETRVKIQGDSHTHGPPGSWPRGSSVPSVLPRRSPVTACLLLPIQPGSAGRAGPQTDSRCARGVSIHRPVLSRPLTSLSESIRLPSRSTQAYCPRN